MDQEHKDKISIAKSGENSSTAKMTWLQVNAAREEYKTDTISIQQLAEKYNLGLTPMRLLIFNKTWVDPNYNITEAEKILTKNTARTGDRNPRSKLTWDKVNEIRAYMKDNPNASDLDIAQKYNMNRSSITYLRLNKTWHDPNWAPIVR
jgi:hypothetical protein